MSVKHKQTHSQITLCFSVSQTKSPPKEISPLSHKQIALLLCLTKNPTQQQQQQQQQQQLTPRSLSASLSVHEASAASGTAPVHIQNHTPQQCEGAKSDKDKQHTKLRLFYGGNIMTKKRQVKKKLCIVHRKVYFLDGVI